MPAGHNADGETRLKLLCSDVFPMRGHVVYIPVAI